MDENKYKTIRRAIGKNMAEKRKARDIPLKVAGPFVDVSYQQIQKYENGISSVISEKLLMLSVLYQCPVQEFFKGVLEAYNGMPTADDYGVEQLLYHFMRIPSHELRDHLCQMIRSAAEANAVASKPEAP